MWIRACDTRCCRASAVGVARCRFWLVMAPSYSYDRRADDDDDDVAGGLCMMRCLDADGELLNTCNCACS